MQPEMTGSFIALTVGLIIAYVSLCVVLVNRLRGADIRFRRVALAGMAIIAMVPAVGVVLDPAGTAAWVGFALLFTPIVYMAAWDYYCRLLEYERDPEVQALRAARKRRGASGLRVKHVAYTGEERVPWSALAVGVIFSMFLLLGVVTWARLRFGMTGLAPKFLVVIVLSHGIGIVAHLWRPVQSRLMNAALALGGRLHLARTDEGLLLHAALGRWVPTAVQWHISDGNSWHVDGQHVRIRGEGESRWELELGQDPDESELSRLTEA